MIHPEKLYELLTGQGIEFYCGVPDSLLKDFLQLVDDRTGDEQHVITANEGLAIGLATGYHLATQKLPLVYLQNSGFGNTINPLTSLADKDMYGIPMLLMIGWRGRPGVQDEPQHLKMGAVTLSLLEALAVPYFIIDGNTSTWEKDCNTAIALAKENKQPVALVITENIFTPYKKQRNNNACTLDRAGTIQRILDALNGDETVFCTTGKIGREFYDLNNAAGDKIKRYFLSVGAMGHANHIALGVHMQSRNRTLMIDGDGALLMQLGGLPAIARYAPERFIHIVLNNGVHESVGGQPTEAFNADLCDMAKAAGYLKVLSVNNEEELQQWLTQGFLSDQTQFVEIRVSDKTLKQPGRPAGNPADWKENFMNAIKEQ